MRLADPFENRLDVVQPACVAGHRAGLAAVGNDIVRHGLHAVDAAAAQDHVCAAVRQTPRNGFTDPPRGTIHVGDLAAQIDPAHIRFAHVCFSPTRRRNRRMPSIQRSWSSALR